MAAVESEGIHLYERTIVTRILAKDGQVVGVELAETGRGMTKDEKGRRRPKIKLDTEFIV